MTSTVYERENLCHRTIQEETAGSKGNLKSTSFKKEKNNWKLFQAVNNVRSSCSKNLISRLKFSSRNREMIIWETSLWARAEVLFVCSPPKLPSSVQSWTTHTLFTHRLYKFDRRSYLQLAKIGHSEFLTSAFLLVSSYPSLRPSRSWPEIFSASLKMYFPSQN